MIKSIIKAFESDITSLPWVERYGGITTLLEHPKEKGENQFSSVIYPITDSVSPESCWDTPRRYKAVVPDSSYKSIFYFEMNQAPQIIVDQVSRRNKYSQFRSVLQVCIWLNLKELGLDINTARHFVEKDLIRALGSQATYKKWAIPGGFDFTSDEVGDIRTYISTLHTPSFTINNVFGKYNYKGSDRLYLYPHEVISCTLAVEWKMFNGCLTAWTPGAALTCENLTLA